MTPIVNTVHFHQLHIVKTGRVALFLAAGFVRVALKELLLSGVPHRTPPVKSYLPTLQMTFAGQKYTFCLKVMFFA